MKAIIVDAQDEKVVYQSAATGKTLGEIFKNHLESIEICEINGEFDDNWQAYKVTKDSEIKIYCNVKDAGILISLLISLAFTALATLFAPTPNKPSASKNQPALGVAGIQNTIAPGTPKFLVYGVRRVFGHLIGSKVDVIDPPPGLPDNFGQKMTYSALYFMGSGPIQEIDAVQINGSSIEDLGDGEAGYHTRLGTDDQEIIPGHELVHQTYHDGKQMDARTTADLNRDPRSIIYTTKSSNIHKVTLFFQFPQGMWTNNKGIPNGQTYTIRVESKEHNIDCDWIVLGDFTNPRVSLQAGFFWKIEVELPYAKKWDLRLSVAAQNSFRATTAVFNLFNVQETQYLRTTYPGNALLEIHGVASDQITSFEQMETSALVCGRFVDVYTNGGYIKQFSRNRVWIVRDLLFNQEVGLGNRLSESLWDNGAGIDAANYYEESVTSLDGGTEQRDFCDVIINETRSGSDHIKALLFEGNATIIPSGGKLKYVIDKDKTPNLLYSVPGNIIENTLQYQRGSNDKPINTIRAEFPDESAEYKVVPAKYPDSVSEPERAETISLTSITRESQASRIMQFRYKYLTLIKDKWTFQCPGSVAVSEPLDVEKLAYQVSKGLRGYSGFVTNNSSTTDTIYIGKSVFLATGFTYTIHVRQQSTVEERFVSNALGNTYSIISVSSPLSFTPTVGDIWSLGKKDQYARTIQFDEVEYDGENYNVTVHGHIPSVYDNQATKVTIPGATTITLFPRPLLSAQALVGTCHSNFNVIPGYDPLVGSYTSIGTNSVIVANTEPNLDDFFNTAHITIGVESLEVVDYTGTSREVITEDPGFLAAGSTGSYSIEWRTASPFYGFSVEGSTQSIGPFSSTGITPSTITGVTLTTTFPTPATYEFFRFTPHDAGNHQNTNARWVIAVGTTDTAAPIPPVSVNLSSNSNREVTETVLFNSPLERDVQYVECEFLLGGPTGVGLTYAKTLVDISSLRNESKTLGVQTSVTANLSPESFGTTIYGRASVIDFYGNKSEGATSFTGVTLSAVEVDDPVETTLLESTTNIDFSG